MTDETKVQAEVTKVVGYIKIHYMWAIGVACFVVGAILGHAV